MAGDTTPGKGSPPEALAQRIIKRYSNRKLYDTQESRYVTLLDVAELVRAGEDVQVIDNGTREDKTDVTLALIISEELKARPRGIPLTTLTALIRSRDGKPLNQPRDGSAGRVLPKESTDPLQVADRGPPGRPGRNTAEPWARAIDERIHAALADAVALKELQVDLKRLAVRLEQLENRLAEREGKPRTD
ncbi:MAG: polyhydroxyalkanoate synthesis regulator DNA-binding domain-containing protein [Polyangiaceae bacterium]|nr:polyhydroxyalkanoate synthesis regulator DNA-binding domain-containing protein [Polyangiaceae bacterium]